MPVTILPCPFCGSIPSFPELKHGEGQTCQIHCVQCGIEAPGGEQTNEAAAISKWNSRPHQATIRFSAVPSINGLMSDEVARDLWRDLHRKASAGICSVLRDQLTAKEREFYDSLTELLSLRAKLVFTQRS